MAKCIDLPFDVSFYWEKNLFSVERKLLNHEESFLIHSYPVIIIIIIIIFTKAFQ